MFKNVLTIGGRSGLFKMISQSKNYAIVESLSDGKRSPSYANEKISMLNNIAMFSNTSEKHLGELFKIVFDLEKGGKIAVDVKNNTALEEYFVKIMPDFDRSKIYSNDIKKFVIWYNILIDSNITDFEMIEEKDDKETDEHNEAEKEIKKEIKKTDKKPKAAVQKTAPKISTKSAAAKQPTRVAVKKGS